MFDRTFGPFLLGKLVGSIGIWIHNIAAAIVVFDATRSAAMVGAVSIAQFVPQILLTPWTGTLADRGDRKRQLVAGRLLTASGSIAPAISIWFLGDSGTAVAIALIAASAVVGVGISVGSPAMHSLIPSLVKRDELADAVTLNAIPFTVARAIGPAIGALMLTVLRPGTVFMVAGATNILFGLVLMAIHVGDRTAPVPADTSIRKMWAHLRVDPVIATLIAGVAMIGVGTDPAITLAPSLADALGGDNTLVGRITSAFGTGSVIGFLIVSRVRRRLGEERVAAVGMALLAAGIGSPVVIPAISGTIGGFLVAGLGMTFALTALTSLIQHRVPEELRGRVMALWAVAFLGSRPFAAALNGALADSFGVRVAMAVAAVAMVGGLLVVWPSRIRRLAE